MGDLVEFFKALGWYFQRKSQIVGGYFEVGKSLVVEILKARRGTYQKPFLHVGMVFLATVAVVSAPIIINQYPTSASTSAVSPSAVLNASTDISQVEIETVESVKPRRDVVEYEVKGGDTLSSIGKSFAVDVPSIAILNNFSKDKILKPGETIKIPPVTGVIVKVQSGDTIYSLAKKHGLAAAQPIVDWPYNTFSNDETFALAAGQTLVIPGGKPPAELPPAPRVILNTPLFAGGTGQFIWPTTGIITQYFAWYHPADDIANAVGTPILAADFGRVQSVLREVYGYGWHIIINHGNGFSTLYGHLSRIDVTEGQNVSRGQVIAAMGNTGRSTGSHLHFEVHQGGSRINPLSVLK